MQPFGGTINRPGWAVCPIIVAALIGCRSGGQTTFTNPFLSPDRVPPPATRTLVPGTAQPYYPGDPVPVLQGAMPANNGTLARAASTPPAPATARPIPPGPLHSAPTNRAPLNPAPPATFAPTVTSTPAPAVQPVTLDAMPGADRSPALEKMNTTVADTGFTPPAMPAAASPRSSRPLQAATTASGNESYASAPVAWQKPGLRSGHSRPSIATPPRVELQPVASPPREPAPFVPQGPAPRIRLPAPPQSNRSTAAAAGQLQPVAYSTPAGVPQTVRITELPPR